MGMKSISFLVGRVRQLMLLLIFCKLIRLFPQSYSLAKVSTLVASGRSLIMLKRPSSFTELLGTSKALKKLGLAIQLVMRKCFLLWITPFYIIPWEKILLLWQNVINGIVSRVITSSKHSSLFCNPSLF